MTDDLSTRGIARRRRRMTADLAGTDSNAAVRAGAQAANETRALAALQTAMGTVTVMDVVAVIAGLRTQGYEVTPTTPAPVAGPYRAVGVAVIDNVTGETVERRATPEEAQTKAAQYNAEPTPAPVAGEGLRSDPIRETRIREWAHGRTTALFEDVQDDVRFLLTELATARAALSEPVAPGLDVDGRTWHEEVGHVHDAIHTECPPPPEPKP